MQKTSLLLIIMFPLWYSCQEEDRRDPSQVMQLSVDSTDRETKKPLPPRSLLRNGKFADQVAFRNIYRPGKLDTLPLPIIDEQTLQVLHQQKRLLETIKPRKSYRIGNLSFNTDQLEETVEILQSRQHTLPFDLSKVLDAHQIWGRDRRGHVLFTGYFTPIIPVAEKQSSDYPYPIYDRPSNWLGSMPTRADIERDGALDSLDLVIAYAKNKVDIYYMQLQGSGFVEYPDGRRVLLSYNGTNRHPYRSIEKYLLARKEWEVNSVSITGVKNFLRRNPELQDSVLFQNPSYTFFKARFRSPQGAGNVPLTANFSVAVDKRYIPLGSCLLAAVPIYDPKLNRVTGHEFQFVFAQDTGGSIKGPGHIDFYFGTGPEARKAAMNMRSYGRLWLLLPKKTANSFAM